ncbi:hypothetical protein SNEBB_008106 [Seison nebaliae]|nr:hypothetical protein SNEBB_008106 [Seison nebaliae]
MFINSDSQSNTVFCKICNGYCSIINGRPRCFCSKISCSGGKYCSHLLSKPKNMCGDYGYTRRRTFGEKSKLLSITQPIDQKDLCFKCVCNGCYKGKYCTDPVNDLCANKFCSNEDKCVLRRPLLVISSTSFVYQKCQPLCNDGGQLLTKTTNSPLMKQIAVFRMPLRITIKKSCLNNGKFVERENKCLCENGYSGDKCEKIIKLIVQHVSCKNNGTGISHPIFPSIQICKCYRYTYGKFCELTICQLHDKLCLNGGNCIYEPNLLIGYQCQCSKGFFGTFCEKKLLKNTTLYCSYCKNGSKCKDSKCLCLNGTFGEYCQFIQNFKYYLESGTNDYHYFIQIHSSTLVLEKKLYCVNKNDQVNCSEERKLSVNCSTKGYLLKTTTGFVCYCQIGRFGNYCEYDGCTFGNKTLCNSDEECISRIVPHPSTMVYYDCIKIQFCTSCGVNGKCSADNRTCKCNDGYYGNICEKHICDDIHHPLYPCNGTNTKRCLKEKLAPFYSCNCQNGYVGAFCNEHICQTKPCHNSTNCHGRWKSPYYDCICKEDNADCWREFYTKKVNFHQKLLLKYVPIGQFPYLKIEYKFSALFEKKEEIFYHELLHQMINDSSKFHEGKMGRIKQQLKEGTLSVTTRRKCENWRNFNLTEWSSPLIDDEMGNANCYFVGIKILELLFDLHDRSIDNKYTVHYSFGERRQEFVNKRMVVDEDVSKSTPSIDVIVPIIKKLENSYYLFYDRIQPILIFGNHQMEFIYSGKTNISPCSHHLDYGWIQLKKLNSCHIITPLINPTIGIFIDPRNKNKVVFYVKNQIISHYNTSNILDHLKDFL